MQNYVASLCDYKSFMVGIPISMRNRSSLLLFSRSMQAQKVGSLESQVESTASEDISSLHEQIRGSDEATMKRYLFVTTSREDP